MPCAVIPQAERCECDDRNPNICNKPGCLNKPVYMVDLKDPRSPFRTTRTDGVFMPMYEVVDFDAWFETARKLSIEYPDWTVACSNMSRNRRIYQNGKILRDFPVWPYSGPRDPAFKW